MTANGVKPGSFGMPGRHAQRKNRYCVLVPLLSISSPGFTLGARQTECAYRKDSWREQHRLPTLDQGSSRVVRATEKTAMAMAASGAPTI